MHRTALRSLKFKLKKEWRFHCRVAAAGKMARKQANKKLFLNKMGGNLKTNHLCSPLNSELRKSASWYLKTSE